MLHDVLAAVAVAGEIQIASAGHATQVSVRIWHVVASVRGNRKDRDYAALPRCFPRDSQCDWCTFVTWIAANWRTYAAQGTSWTVSTRNR
jgi:hypothetical protein